MLKKGIWKSLSKSGEVSELGAMSMETNNIYKEDFISAKVKMASSQKDHVELSGNRSPPPRNDLGIEIERLRGNQDLAHTDLLSPSPNKFISSPPRSMPSPSRRDDFTPVTAPTERGVLPTPDLATSIGHVGSDMETPSTWYEEGLGFEITVLSDIPEFDNFAGVLENCGLVSVNQNEPHQCREDNSVSLYEDAPWLLS
ncbi:hypothetical protein MTR67_010964 [Solanum verrucosum]|uniref:Uncharacterized protein n=1 Tax=Solanum verrucosum TaxID=315347 RepID=A0AAF0Q5Y1_SOLVR|nr:hypothetical protein MTR67_010964 [Solanum verrucosum]